MPESDSRTAPRAAMHGLHGEWAEADWPAWTLDEVDAMLCAYDGAGRALELLSASPRPFSAAARVRTTTGNVFVKRHALAVRSRESLEEEHALVAWLAARTALVTAPLRALDGRTATVTGAWVCEVFPIAEGCDLYEQAMSWTPYFSVEQARAAGAALAALHRATAGFAAPPRRVAPLVTSFTLIPAQHPILAFRAYCAARPMLGEWLLQRDAERALMERFLPHHARVHHARVMEHGEALAPLWTHNDWHGSNLMWSGAGEAAHVTAVVDFGLADSTCAVHDLATAIERSAIAWLVAEDQRLAHAEQAQALLNGYTEQASLTAVQRHAVAAMLPIVHCEFALSEVEYFLRLLGDEARAQVAWQQYCLGHIDWFDTVEGKRLIAALQAWAEDGR